MTVDHRLQEPYQARLEALAADVVAYIAKRAAVRAVSVDAAMYAAALALERTLERRRSTKAAPSVEALLAAYYGEGR